MHRLFFFLAVAVSHAQVLELSVTPANAVLSAPVTLRATVSQAQGAGRVYFQGTFGPLGTAVPDGNGIASLVRKNLPTGTNEIWAIYRPEFGEAIRSASARVKVQPLPTGGFGQLAATERICQNQADFDGDGSIDLLCYTNSSGFVRSWFVVLAPGSGSERRVALPALGDATVVNAGDLDEDGRADVMIALSGADAQVQIFRGNALRSIFDEPIRIRVQPRLPNSAILALQIRDFNGDGLSDIGLGTQTTSFVLLQEPGLSGLQFRPLVLAGGPAAVVRFEYLDRDGRCQILLSRQDTNRLEIWRLTEANEFALVTTIPFLSPIADIAVGDWNGDGIQDVLLAEQRLIHFHAGKPGGGYSGPFTSRIAAYPRYVSTLDWDGDGVLDLLYYSLNIASGQPGENFFRVARGLGDGSFGEGLALSEKGTALQAAPLILDANSDGRLDIVTSEWTFYGQPPAGPPTDPGTATTAFVGAEAGNASFPIGGGFARGFSQNAEWLEIVPRGDPGVARRLYFRFAANPGAGPRTGRITLGSQVFTVTQAGLPEREPAVTGSEPFSVSGESSTLRITYGDAQGVDDLSQISVLINRDLDGTKACFVVLVPRAKLLYIVADDGTTLGPPRVASYGFDFRTIENPQCRINTALVREERGPGNRMTLSLPILLTGLRGRQLVFASAADNGGNSSRWQAVGVWDQSARTDAPLFSNSRDPLLQIRVAGRDIQKAHLRVLNPQEPEKECLISYDRGTNRFTVAEKSAAWCSVVTEGSLALPEQDGISLALSLRFGALFAGRRTIYAGSDDAAGKFSGWSTVGIASIP